MSNTVALRTALIWHDEVMNDVVSHAPGPITLGATGKSTFTVPDLDLPPNFAIVRPGNRGYLLTLGDKMRGTISVDGQEKDVGDFVRHGDVSQSGFHATQISGRDWGVVDLDESGDYKLFFQFVPIEDKRSLLVPMIMAALIGWLVCGGVMTGILEATRRIDIDDAIFNGFAIVTILLVGLGIIVGSIYWFVICDMELQLSHVFSLLLHGALIAFCIIVYEPNNSYVWPGPREMTADYFVTRLQPDPPPEPEKPKDVGKVAAAPAPKNESNEHKPTATKGPEGAAGGQGEHERATTKHFVNDKPAPPPVALMTSKNAAQIQNVIDRSLSTDLTKFAGIPGETDKEGSVGHGHAGKGSGVGDHCRAGTACSGTRTDSNGNGHGGGGTSNKDFVSSGKPVAGEAPAKGQCVGDGCNGTGAKKVGVSLAGPVGDTGGYSAEEIDKVVRTRAGLYKACYQKELNHSAGIGGKMTLRFSINGDTGHVSAASAGGFGNAEVESCVARNIRGLVFPIKQGIGTANITYPFVFSQGG
jgi:hypothetical protein